MVWMGFVLLGCDLSGRACKVRQGLSAAGMVMARLGDEKIGNVSEGKA